jgi:hypothetical protein
MTHENSNFPDKVFYSDESIIHLDGQIIRHNMVFYSHVRPPPDFDFKKPMAKGSVMVWAGMSYDRRFVDSYFFDDTVTVESYVEMLENQFWPTAHTWG